MNDRLAVPGSAPCALLTPAHFAVQAQTNAVGDRGRNAPALPGVAADRHQQPAGQRDPRRRIPEAACSTRKAFPTRSSPRTRPRANIVARLKGNGKKRPILIMGHTDVVTVDPAKWTHPPFGAVRDGGYVYGRGAVDDKDNLVAGVMLMLMLKRGNVPLDRDVILLAESGEEGAPDVGAQFMADNHLDAINAEYCLAEGGGVVRTGGRDRAVQHRHHGKGAALRRAHRARTGRARLGAVAQQRGHETVGGGRQGGAMVAAAAHQRNHRRVFQAAGDHGARPRWRRCIATCSIRTRRSRRPPRTGCSTTSPITGRCCTPRSCPPSSAAASATT